MKKDVTLHLGHDEALVLGELLFRWLEQENGQRIREQVHDDAELWAMNALSALLEKAIPEIFGPDYGAALEAASKRIKEANGGSWPK